MPYFIVEETIEIECFSYLAITEFISKFHVQTLKKFRGLGGIIYKLALVKEVRT